MAGLVGRMATRGRAFGSRMGAIGKAALPGVALGGGFVASKLLEGAQNTAMSGSAFTNPMFNMPSKQGYGKRGIDANNLGTNGLTQSLHKNRRKF